VWFLSVTAWRRHSAKVMKRTSNSAYPKVISNLGALQDKSDTQVVIRMIRFMNHYCRSVRERQALIAFFEADRRTPVGYFDTDPLTRVRSLVPLGVTSQAFPDIGGRLGTSKYLRFMNDYFAVGFANTLGFAHANTGDTMTSVMIGGLRTVMNGDFEVFAGDLVQFYWMFEKDDFEQDGRRKAYKDIWQDDGTPLILDPTFSLRPPNRKRNAAGQMVDGAGASWQTPADARIRQAHYDLSYGQRPDRQKIVAKIKPYFRDDENPRLMDWFRVFGVAIASARPNEMCDIKISRQSM
jgi:hypothetical protein